MLIALGIVLVVLTALWVVGSQEPVYRLGGVGEAWFVALKGADEAALNDEARIVWRSKADFALIGADDAYWTRFCIVRTAGASPLRADAKFEDAFVARIRLFTPPKLALGVLRTLVRVGILPTPRGAIAQEAQHLGQRADLMPTTSGIAQLLAQPSSYAPAMVNFLRYNQNGGAASYRKYGMVALRTVFRAGGALLFYAKVLEIVRTANAGPTLGAWDDLAAMRYPNPPAILSMEHAPAYRAALHHRDEGLAATVVIASHELPRA